MHHSWTGTSLGPLRHLKPRAGGLLPCRVRRQPTYGCWRGKGATGDLLPVACSPSSPYQRDEDDNEGYAVRQGAGDEASVSGVPRMHTPERVDDADTGLLAISHRVTADAALAGMAAEARDSSIIPASPSHMSTKPAISAGVNEQQSSSEAELFDVLDSVHIDTKSAGYFLSQLAMHDSWGNPLTVDELLHAARIAGISGFALPPILAAQLQNLVQAAGPLAASASVQSLLAAFRHDLPALLGVLRDLEVTPSFAWTEYALHAWLRGDGNSAADGGNAAAASGIPAVGVAEVRTLMTHLEAMYLPEADPGTEPGGGGAASVMPYAATRLTSWLDACVSTLLDGGGLAWPHQREGLYDMLPYFATAPSAAIVERLYDKAWQSPSAGGAEMATAPAPMSVEAMSAMLWLVAASGAKVPPDAVQEELRRLEYAIACIAAYGRPWGPIVQDTGNRSGTMYDNSVPVDSFDDGSSSSSSGAVDASASPFSAAAAAAAAAAALSAAFALPSVPGSEALPASPPHPSSSSSSSFPPSFPSALRSSSSPSYPSSWSGHLSPHTAYRVLWAFHHYRHLPHPANAPSVGSILLSAALTGTQSHEPATHLPLPQQFLSPRQRCRVLRSLLLCFPAAAQSQLLARHDWAPLLTGWHALGASELLALLQDVATLARQRRRTAGGGGAGDSVWSTLSGGGVRLHLSHLAAHVVQLPDWQERLAGAGLAAALGSIGNLMAILGMRDGEEEKAEDAPADSAAAVAAGDGSFAVGLGVSSSSSSVDGGASGEDGVASHFAHELLSTWLACVLPVVQNGVKEAMVDWSSSGRAAQKVPTAAHPPSRQPSHHNHQQQQQQQQQHSSSPSHSYYSYDPYDPGNSGAGGTGASGASWQGRTERSSSPLAVASAEAGASLWSAVSPSATPQLLPSLPTAAASAAGAEVMVAAAPALTAVELTSALKTLRGAAAALDGRSRAQQDLRRTIMWAMQRLGSRAARCAVHPSDFGRVPEMLIWMDALGWVDVPLEWAEAVVRHSDEATSETEDPAEECGLSSSWFQSLSWQEALGAVLASGQLVQRARAEVLRRHGASSSDALPPPPYNGQAPYSDAAAANLAAAAVAADIGSSTTFGALKPEAKSRAEAFLAVSHRLRNHMLEQLTARAAACDVTDLRQLALTWQVYDLPYDKEALAATLKALYDALMGRRRSRRHGVAAGGGEGFDDYDWGWGAGGGLASGPVFDTVMRLQALCRERGAAQGEVDALFEAWW